MGGYNDRNLETYHLHTNETINFAGLQLTHKPAKSVVILSIPNSYVHQVAQPKLPGTVYHEYSDITATSVCLSSEILA